MYLTPEDFEELTCMPQEQVVRVNRLYPKFIEAHIAAEEARLNGRLRKRYALAPTDPTVRGWLVKILTPIVWRKGGVDPLDAQYSSVVEEAKTAADEIKEAADCVDGLFDLPLRPDTTQSGITKGGPYGSSSASPYAPFDEQARIGRGQDGNG